MKKNKMLRIASAVMMATLLSTCVISGTFAKYTTSYEAKDTARVAAWGVEITATGDTFASAYDNVVAGSAELAVIAPGTEGNFVAFTIAGTPEVAVSVTYDATIEIKGWDIESSFYCPIVFTVGNEEIKQDETNNTAEALAAAVVAAIEAYTQETIAAGAGLSTATAPSVKWAWAYDGDDVKDTALGNLETAPTIVVTVTATVTQID